MYLYKVNQYSEPQKNVAQTVIRENIKINELGNENKAMLAIPMEEIVNKNQIESKIDKTLEELVECTRGLNEHNTPYYKEARILWEQFHNYFEVQK